MQFSNLLLATVASLVSAGVVHLPLQARSLSSDVIHGEVTSTGAYYVAEFELGTPAQKIKAVFDTGSMILAIPGRNSKQCAAGTCNFYGDETSFDDSKSSTWKSDFSSEQWGGQGHFGTDNLTFAGTTVSAQPWVSTEWNGNSAIWGMGDYRGNPQAPDQTYPRTLLEEGKISRGLFSVHADAPVEDSHYTKRNPTNVQVYFGGFDDKKYEGPLTTMNLTVSRWTYTVPVEFIVDGELVPQKREWQILADTGGISISLPNNTMQAIAAKHGGFWDTKREKWAIDCDAEPIVEYKFGETLIPVPLKQFVHHEIASSSKCELTQIRVSNDEGGDGVLGTGPPFLSRALIVFDIERDQLTIGKAKYTDETNVVEISDKIPGAVFFGN